MSCGGRLNKGAGATIVIPLYVENVDDASVSFYTDGSESVEAESVVIEHGQVVATLSKTDLDLLSDGVLRYTLDYVVDGEEYTISSDTTSYLKTPVGYSAVSLTEVIEEAREDGYAEGEVVGKAEGYVSGYTQGEQVGYDNGYSQGYEQGQADCPECSGGSCTLQDNYEVYLNGTETAGQLPIAPNAGYDGIANGTIYYYEAYQAKYAEGYAAGQAQCSGSSCNLSLGVLDLQSGDSGTWIMYADHEGLDGYDQVQITDVSYGQSKYNQGYSDGYDKGQEQCPECSGSTCNLENGAYNLESDFTDITIYPSEGFDGFSEFRICDLSYGANKYHEGFTNAFKLAKFDNPSAYVKTDIVVSDFYSGLKFVWDLYLGNYFGSNDKVYLMSTSNLDGGGCGLDIILSLSGVSAAYVLSSYGGAASYFNVPFNVYINAPIHVEAVLDGSNLMLSIVSTNGAASDTLSGMTFGCDRLRMPITINGAWSSDDGEYFHMTDNFYLESFKTFSMDTITHWLKWYPNGGLGSCLFDGITEDEYYAQYYDENDNLQYYNLPGVDTQYD